MGFGGAACKKGEKTVSYAIFAGVEGGAGEAKKFEALKPDCNSSWDVAGWTEKSARCTDDTGDDVEVPPEDGTPIPPMDALWAVAAAIVARWWWKSPLDGVPEEGWTVARRLYVYDHGPTGSILGLTNRLNVL